MKFKNPINSTYVEAEMLNTPDINKLGYDIARVCLRTHAICKPVWKEKQVPTSICTNTKSKPKILKEFKKVSLGVDRAIFELNPDNPNSCEELMVWLGKTYPKYTWYVVYIDLIQKSTEKIGRFQRDGVFDNPKAPGLVLDNIDNLTMESEELTQDDLNAFANDQPKGKGGMNGKGGFKEDFCYMKENKNRGFTLACQLKKNPHPKPKKPSPKNKPKKNLKKNLKKNGMFSKK